MKRIFKKLFKEKVWISLGLIMGTIITGAISYGINNIQSSSVSYTKDGKTMSVEEAIDDLIVKVNTRGSGGVFNITLREQKMSVSGSTTTTWLKGFIDETLNTMFASIDNLKEVNTDELKKLKNGNYTWSSSDTNIVTIDGTTVTPKKAGNVNVIATTEGGASVTIPLVISDSLYLADVANVGDYVAYDAGTWTSSTDKPTEYGTFGGYTKGQNKANSAVCVQTSIPLLKGWRILKIDKDTKTVTLVHAGQPECYNHECSSGRSSQSITNLNNRAASVYLNSAYASSAHHLNYDEAFAITGSDDQTTNNLRSTGGHYWLATSSTRQGYSDSYLNIVYPNGNGGSIIPTYSTSACFPNGAPWGTRPVVVLKSNILTTGKGTDAVGQTAWTLVKP